jgi:hypothetical protein
VLCVGGWFTERTVRTPSIDSPQAIFSPPNPSQL